MKNSRLFSLITSLGLLLILLGGLVFRQEISDWLRLRGYTPPAEVAALADRTTMVDSSRRLFYVHHPLIADKSTFNEHCRENEQTIVLGCFVSREGIYLLDVTDERLSGVEEVTAAHELLHAAYERLSESERRNIDSLLHAAYGNVTNPRVRETVELYTQQDASVVPNELHSILGTEVRDLPAELETYYRRYFSDRLKIVGYSDQYEQAFTERRDQIKAFDAQLASLKAQIEGLQSDLQARDAELKSQRARMNDLRNSGQTAAYNAEVPSYNAKVNRFNRDIDTLTDLIATYNDIVLQRNAVASEEAELVEAIDSREVVPEQQ